MEILLRKATIVDHTSPHHMKTRDIHISNGVIEKIAKSIDHPNAQIIESPNLTITPGWYDLFTFMADPGMEQRETIQTALDCAAAGGFTHISSLPNTNPSISNKSSIEYTINKAKGHITSLLPYGSITSKLDGEHLAEMIDMYHAGAVAFSDGFSAIHDDGLMLKALEYTKSIDRPLVQMPVHKILSSGQMNEGNISVRLGMAGIPNIAEKLIVNRDIELARYTEAAIHITGISAAESLALIKQAKKDGIKVTCSVSPFHLFYTDNNLEGYDSLYKLCTPLRTERDRKALIKGLTDGTVDGIASHHIPVDSDGKDVEFSYASPGMISLQTVFPILVELGLDISEIDKWLSHGPRRSIGLSTKTIDNGSEACMTIIDPSMQWNYNQASNRSLSSNSSLMHSQLKGKVLGIINNNQVYLNEF